MHIRQNPCRYGIRLPYGFRIVKGGYINIDRNKAVIQDCRLYVHFTQHVDICLLDVFARVDFLTKLLFPSITYEYQTTGSNEPLIAEFNVYFLHCTASACLLILSLYRIMHDDTVKKQNFV